jgi:hypothetical protein
MSRVKPPKDFRERLKAAAERHGYGSAEELCATLLRRGLKDHLEPGAPPGDPPGDPEDLGDRLAAVAARRGYASREELIEHLLEQGLRPLESPEDTGEVEARLKGLGYIE